jgi:murein peptide amidase A
MNLCVPTLYPGRDSVWAGFFSALAAILAMLSVALGTAPARDTDDLQVQRMAIGHSVRHRPIDAVAIGAAAAPRRLLLIGCIHGNECAGLRIVAALERTRPPTGVQLWLVPEMNPDGTAAGTRQNAHGVDLNRNFPYRWRPIGNPTYYSGPRSLSEPESQTAARLIQRVRPAVTVWYHQHESLVDMTGADRGVARRYAQLAHLRAICLPFLPGTAILWSNHRFPGTNAFVVELPAGRVSDAALADHLSAVRALELGQRMGSATRFAQ